MKISYRLVCGLVLTGSGLLIGQQSSISGPVAGFVFDGGAHVLRPIQGIPGASLIGDPLNFGFALNAAYVSPTQDLAFVVAADYSLHLFRLNGSGVSEIGLGGISGTPQSVLFSPSGTSAALFAMGKARILTGLPDAPTLAGTINIPNFEHRAAAVRGDGLVEFEHPATATLAISDDGTYLAAVSQDSVRLLGIHGDSRTLVASQSNAMVAFAAGGHDVAVMDALGGLMLIRNASGTGTPQVLAGPDDGLAGAAGVAFSRDKQTLYVASATAQAVAVFDLAGGKRTAIGCACTPSTLIPMGNTFRLNDVSPTPLWILDAAAGTPRTVFVPARGE